MIEAVVEEALAETALADEIGEIFMAAPFLSKLSCRSICWGAQIERDELVIIWGEF